MPVARKVWHPIAVSMPAPEARRRIMRQTSMRDRGNAREILCYVASEVECVMTSFVLRSTSPPDRFAITRSHPANLLKTIGFGRV